MTYHHLAGFIHPAKLKCIKIHMFMHLGVYFVILLIPESDEFDYLQDNMNLYPTTRGRIQYLMFPLLSCQCLLGIDM